MVHLFSCKRLDFDSSRGEKCGAASTRAKDIVRFVVFFSNDAMYAGARTQTGIFCKRMCRKRKETQGRVLWETKQRANIQIHARHGSVGLGLEGLLLGLEWMRDQLGLCCWSLHQQSLDLLMTRRGWIPGVALRLFWQKNTRTGHGAA